jgi:hypothetical protein
MYESDDLNILDAMIQDSAKVSLTTTPYNKNKVLLTETHGVNYQVQINNLPKNTLVIKSDEFSAPTGFFNGTKGECKRADYVIVSDEGDRKVMIFIEMKAGDAEKKEVIQQLKGSEALMKYCQKIGQLFWEESNFLTEYDLFFIGLTNINIDKGRSRKNKNIQRCDRPEHMFIINSAKTLIFNRLIGKLP